MEFGDQGGDASERRKENKFCMEEMKVWRSEGLSWRMRVGVGGIIMLELDSSLMILRKCESCGMDASTKSEQERPFLDVRTSYRDHQYPQ